MALTLLLSEVLSHCTHTEHDCLSHDLNTTQYVSKYVARARKATDLGFPKKKTQPSVPLLSSCNLNLQPLRILNNQNSKIVSHFHI